MNIALIGSTGWIGSKISVYLKKAGYNVFEPSRKDIVIYDPKEIEKFVLKNSIEFLINSAGFTGKPNVDACEDSKEQCYVANSILPEMLSRGIENTECDLINIGSGCVYDGYGSYWTEWDLPNFVPENGGSYYSYSKIEGEESLENFYRFYNLRIRMPFDGQDNDRNLLVKLDKYPKIVNSTNSVTSIKTILNSILHIIKNYPEYGHYNIVESNPISSEEILQILQERMRTEDKELLEIEQLNEITRANRSNCILSNQLAIDNGFRFFDTKTVISKCAREIARCREKRLQ